MFASGQTIYTYVKGSPIVYTDPSGLLVWSAIGAGFGAVVGGISGGIQAASGPGPVNWGSVAVGAAVGALGGAVSGAFPGWLGNSVLSGAISAVGNAANQWQTAGPGCFNGWAVAGSFANGFAANWIGGWVGGTVFAQTVVPGLAVSAFGAMPIAQITNVVAQTGAGLGFSWLF